jgi:hypothetical protein
MMGSEDGGIPCEVLKVIHDHGHKQIQHLQGTAHTSTSRSPNRTVLKGLGRRRS